MKRISLICLLAACLLASCSGAGQGEQTTTVHEHTPNGANCLQAQCCAECGEQLAEQGAHDYPSEPNSQNDGFSYYVCRTCGDIKIVNENGLPVVPVE